MNILRAHFPSFTQVYVYYLHNIQNANIVAPLIYKEVFPINLYKYKELVNILYLLC